MADELELDLDQLEQNIEIRNKVEQRIKDLSKKVKLTSDERDELAKAKTQLEEDKAIISKERDFYMSFSDSVGKYPDAKDFKEKIKEKVLAGYDVEDATISVLTREGKLNQAPAPVEKEKVAGGSAPNQIKGGAKPLSEMTREEKRAALVDAEARGDISTS